MASAGNHKEYRNFVNNARPPLIPFEGKKVVDCLKTPRIVLEGSGDVGRDTDIR